MNCSAMKVHQRLMTSSCLSTGAGVLVQPSSQLPCAPLGGDVAKPLTHTALPPPGSMSTTGCITWQLIKYNWARLGRVRCALLSWSWCASERQKAWALWMNQSQNLREMPRLVKTDPPKMRSEFGVCKCGCIWNSLKLKRQEMRAFV